jgi:phenylacetate-CoA ligase
MGQPTRSQITVHPLVFHQVMAQAPTAGWQVVHEPGRLRLLVAAPGVSFNQDLVRTTLTAELRRLRLQDPTVVVERTDSIPHTTNGKVRLVVSSPTTSGSLQKPNTA